MPVSGLPPREMNAACRGQFLTFITPALNGCNLKCAHCFIRQRQENSQPLLQPHDLARFIREAADKAPVLAISIQGYEPLLPEALPYTQAILGAAQLLGLPAALVTNGVLLGEASDRLKLLKPEKIGVSLDASSPDEHDHIRGVNGAWDATVHSITKARDILPPQTKLAVISVLSPGKRHRLERMPSLLRSLGVKRWIISPLIRVGGASGGEFVADAQDILRDAEALQRAADSAGVVLTVDDEFDSLRRAVSPESGALPIRVLPAGVDLFRLNADGRCSAGREIMQRVSAEAPQWRPAGENAADFLARVKRRSKNAAYGSLAAA